MEAARQWWRQHQGGWDARALVFIDETGVNTKMVRRYGRAARSERCLGSCPHGHWHTSTFIAALRMDGMQAPWLLDGPMNTQSFEVYVEKILVPTLRPGDVVICDNLRAHKSEQVRKSIEAARASLRFLPAYSPDLNPIEMAFAKLKAALRKAAARSFKPLLNALTQAISAFRPNQCEAFFRHAQYATN